jgi:hypothetical protein
MTKQKTFHSDNPENIPVGFRIRSIPKSNNTKYVVEKRFLGFLWIGVKKPSLEVAPESKAKYRDSAGRGYDIVSPQGLYVQ